MTDPEFQPLRPHGRRLAFMIYGLSGGGMEHSMLRLATAMMTRGYAIDLLVRRREGELADRVPSKISVHELKQGAKSHWRTRMDLLRVDPSALRLVLSPSLRDLQPVGRLKYLPNFVHYLKQWRPDAVLAAEPTYGVLATVGRRVANSPTRVVLREDVQPSSYTKSAWHHPHLKVFLRKWYSAADAIVAVSNGVADDLADLSGIARGRITTIYNPVVGPDITALAQAPIDHPWLTNASTPVVLGVGRLDPQKDFVTLLRAFARVRSERALRLIILGASSAANPSYADELLNLARKLGVGDTVDFPGYVDNPFAYMARAQVFALSSAFEGLPGVLIEALACGCQVVATDCPSGPREILAGGKFGPLVPVGDDVAMAEALKQALDRPRPSESLTERANVFSIDRSVDDYLKVLLDPDDSPATGVSQPPPMATP